MLGVSLNVAHADINYVVHIRDFQPTPEGDGYFCSMYVKNLKPDPVRVSAVETYFLTSNTWNHFVDTVWTVYRANGLTTTGPMVGLWLDDQVRIVAAVYPLDSVVIQPNEDKLFVKMQFNTTVIDPRKTIPERVIMYIKSGSDIINVSSQVQLVIGDLTGVHTNEYISAEDFSLFQNYPNPFNPSTTIEFSIPRASRVVLSAYDVNGRLVQNISDQVFSAGRHSLNWNASGLANGTYLLRLSSEGLILTRPAVLVK